VKSTAALDESLERSASARGSTERLVDGRRLLLANGVWRDAAFSDRLRTVRVRPYSPLYFELMRRIATLQPVFALGDRVLVAGRAVAVELHPDGLDRVDDALLAGVVRDW
jgi:hypothetical protein